MEMTGEQLIHASQAQTWAALNDPEMLKACVPGCESIERSSDTEYVVQMTARVGPVSAKFKGKMTLSNMNPPHSYSIAFEGQGGVAGFAKGSADVSLVPEGTDTRLGYKVKANVGGKLAQIGSRLVDAAANKVANEFFNAFNEKVGARHGAQEKDSHGAHDEHHAAPVPRDPDLPQVSEGTLSFFAAGALVVFVVALMSVF
ncbi:MAG: carbon monoxide dehydrogenase subunit G [Candidatus Parcubacteria bacterium]|nr:carbon monoxide dehydrogenase subunit G [Burkholderiales bacterium]